MKCEVLLNKEELHDLVKSRAEDALEVANIIYRDGGISVDFAPFTMDNADLLEAMTEHFGIELGDMSVYSVTLLGDGGLGIVMVPNRA